MKSHMNTSRPFLNKVVLITGAAGQLGSKIVSSLVQQGASVIATDINLEILHKAVEKENWNLKKVTLMTCNIQFLAEVKSVFDKAIKKFSRIDILINNAGVSVFEPYMDRMEESIDWVMDINLKGTFFCTREFIKHKKTASEDANIVNIASIYGVISPDPRIYTDCTRKNSEIYGATKAGIIQMTRYFAVHAASHNIRVNAVSPGGIRNTELPQGEDFQKNYGIRCPLNRLSEINEVVKPVLFLCSSAASYINGHNLIVDGGMSAW